MQASFCKYEEEIALIAPFVCILNVYVKQSNTIIEKVSTITIIFDEFSFHFTVVFRFTVYSY